MIRFLLLTLFLSIAPLSALADQCRPKPMEMTANEFAQKDFILPSNGSVTISLGTEEGEVLDVFTKMGNPFDGLIISSHQKSFTDDRSWLSKLVFKKPVPPTQYYLDLALQEWKVNEMKGKIDLTNVYVSIKVGARQYKGTLSFTGDISYNCRNLKK